MNDKEFINNLIKVYFSNAKEPHQATLDNAITNRLNDIADKLENQEKVLEIIFKKIVGIFQLSCCKNVYEYNDLKFNNNEKLTQEEFELLKRWQEKCLKN